MPLLLPGLGFTPVTIEQVEITNASRPEGTTGAWVTLMGRGGLGGTGAHVSNSNQNANGGQGGGGGARIGRSFVPVTAMGSTYSLTIGTTGSRFARFTSGSVVLSAGWGADSGGGGVASAVGYSTGIALDNGGTGGAGGIGAVGTSGSGSPGGSPTGGAAGGGGGGGGARSTASAIQGGGGAGGTSTGGIPSGLGKNGANGTNGTQVGNSADGGSGGAGGGYTVGSGRTTPGIAYIRVEWV